MQTGGERRGRSLAFFFFFFEDLSRNVPRALLRGKEAGDFKTYYCGLSIYFKILRNIIKMLFSEIRS